MWEAEIYIGTNIRGPGKGTGKTMYRMRAKSERGKVQESGTSIAEYEQATESRLVLYALRDALSRFHFACKITVYTECSYVSAAIEQNWVETWERNGWKNSRGEGVKDAVLWQEIFALLCESGHILKAERGKHEYSGWMRWQMGITPAWKEVFREMEKKPENLINTEYGGI